MIVSEYKGFRLAAIEQSGGGYQVAITPIAEPVLTMTFRELSDAIDEAHQIVDNVLKPPPSRRP